jgi:hypothetical protein
MTKIRGKPPIRPAKASGFTIKKGDRATLENGAVYEVLNPDVDGESFSCRYMNNLNENDYTDDEPNRVFLHKDYTHAYGCIPPIVGFVRFSPLW